MRDEGGSRDDGAAGGATATNSITLKACRRRLRRLTGRRVMMKKGELSRINRLLAVVNYSPIIAIVAAFRCRSDLRRRRQMTAVKSFLRSCEVWVSIRCFVRIRLLSFLMRPG